MPVYQNDLMSLADVVGPAAAAQQAGIQNENANVAAGLENQRNQATLPFAGPEAKAKVAQTEAQNKALGLSNIFTEQTQPSKINETISGNQLKMSQDQLGKMSMVGQAAIQIADQLDNAGVPDAAKPALFTKQMQNLNVSPEITNAIAQGDPSQLTQRLRSIGNGFIQHSAQYQTELMKQTSEGNRAENVATIGADARTQVGMAMANARRYAADSMVRSRQAQQTFEQAATAAYARHDKATGDQMAQLALKERQAQVELNSQLLGIGSPTAIPGMAPPTNGEPQPQNTGTPAQPTQNGTVVVGDTEWRQKPDGGWQSRKVQK